MNIKNRIIIILSLVIGVASQGFAQDQLATAESEKLFAKGLQLMNNKQYGAAREAFENYAQTTGESARRDEAEFYIAYSGLFLENLGSDTKVEEFANKFPEHPLAKGAFAELGNHYFERGDYERAIKYYTSADLYILGDEELGKANYQLGLSYYQQKQLDQSLVYFDRVKGGRSSYSESAYFYAGIVAFQNGNYFRAQQDLQRIANHPDYRIQVPYYLARIYAEQENYQELATYTAQALDIPRVNSRLEILLLSAEASFQLKDYRTSIERFETYATALRARPADDIRFKMGYAHLQVGNTEQAIEQLKTISSNDLKGQMASYYLGHLYIQQENPQFAITAFDRASKMTFNPEAAENAAFNFAKVSFELGRFRDALNTLEAFSRNYPGSNLISEANDLIIEALLNTNDYAKAIEYIEGLPNRTERINRVYQKVTFYRGTEYFNDQRFPLAVQLFKKSLENPIDKGLVAEAHFWAGEAYSTGNRYDDAIKEYQQVLRNNPPADLRLKTAYGLGYALYNTKEYTQALTQFRTYVQALERADDKLNYNDALLRLADCYFVGKNYQEAVRTYDKAIQQNNPEIDYAYYQKGLVYSYMNNSSTAKENLDIVVKRYPQSRIHDNAILQLGQVDFEDGNYEEAIRTYSLLIERKANSPLVPFALLNRAVSNVNLQRYAQAESDYKAILDKYLNHRTAGSAILGLQEVSAQTGNQDFQRYLSRYRNANPDKQALESIEFESGKALYFNLEYPRAITAFQEFLRTYPQSAFIMEARFYLAESYYRSNEFAKSLELHNILANTPAFPQQNRAINRVAELEYDLKNFQRAIEYYDKLLQIAQNRRDEYTALEGMMLSYYQLNNFNKTTEYAQKILDQGSVSANAEGKANLFLGKAAEGREEFAAAKDFYLNTFTSAKDENGAEAQYLLARLEYREKNYPKSIETLFDLNNQFGGYEEWLGKSFLLLADNYIAQKEWLQARATLNSVSENSPSREIRDEAREKLLLIDKLENESDDNE
ncbi:tetratricopeptide repeat protein [Peijinzhouia sedimentorum]